MLSPKMAIDPIQILNFFGADIPSKPILITLGVIVGLFPIFVFLYALLVMPGSMKTLFSLSRSAILLYAIVVTGIFLYVILKVRSYTKKALTEE